MIRLFNFYVRRPSLRHVAFDVALIIAVVAISASIQVGDLSQVFPWVGTHAVSLAAGLFVINSASGFYETDRARSVGQSCARAIFALLLALPLTYAVLSLLPTQLSLGGDRNVLTWAAMAGVAMVIVRRVYVAHWASVSHPRTRVLVFGSGAAAAVVGTTLKTADPDAHIVGYVPGPNESAAEVPPGQLIRKESTLLETARRHQVDEIIVALTERRSGSMPLRELLDCKLVGVKVHDLSTHFEKTLGQIRIDYLNAGWLVFGDGFNQGTFRSAVKRMFDLVCTALLLVVSTPIMLLAALAIKLESRGPVFYRQERVGLAGSTFEVVKFRSMRVDAEKDGQPRWASANDDRVTRVGRVIRRLRIDELPQLFNVLKGEMSLVGPRPERPFFVEQLTQQVPFFAVRHSVKPGVTGWAQVRYQYGSTVEDAQEKLQFDLYYVKHHSLMLDLLILLETVSVVLTGKGAR